MCSKVRGDFLQEASEQGFRQLVMAPVRGCSSYLLGGGGGEAGTLGQEPANVVLILSVKVHV